MTRTSIHSCYRSSVVQCQGSSISVIFVRGYVFKQIKMVYVIYLVLKLSHFTK